MTGGVCGTVTGGGGGGGGRVKTWGSEGMGAINNTIRF